MAPVLGRVLFAVFLMCPLSSDAISIRFERNWPKLREFQMREMGSGGSDLPDDPNNPYIPKWDVTKPISYAFMNSTFTQAEKQAVAGAMAMWTKGSCVRYREIPYTEDNKNAVDLFLIDMEGAGYAQPQDPETGVVLVAASRDFLLETPLGYMGHEIGHSLGLQHEMGRGDRELNLNTQNILPDKMDQFEVSWGIVEGTPFDVTSLMMYVPNSMSKYETTNPEMYTFETWDPDQQHISGQQALPSFNDLKRINLYYKCADVSCSRKLSSECQNRGYQDPNNCDRCVCPPGTGGTYCDQIEKPVGFGETCGGLIKLDPCTSTTLTLPSYPSTYPFNASCTWILQSTSCNFEFAFEEEPAVDCENNMVCQDWLEIRSNFDRLDHPGKFFCTCNNAKGRKILTNGNLAMVRFQSFYAGSRKPDQRGNGFKLTAMATCPDKGRAMAETNCKIATTGYDVDDSSLPFCGDGKGPSDARPNLQAKIPVPDSASQCPSNLIAQSPPPVPGESSKKRRFIGRRNDVKRRHARRHYRRFY